MDTLLESCKKIFDRSPRSFGIVHVKVDEDGRPTDMTIDYANDAMAATSDCTPEELCGKDVYELWPDGDRMWLDYYYRAAYHGEAKEFETVSVAYQMFQNVVVFPISEGYCGHEVQDVTAWLTHARSNLETVSAGLFFYDTKKQLVLLPDPARECCGVDEGYLTVDEFIDRISEGAANQCMREGFQAFLRDGQQLLCEEQLRNGRWVRISLSHTGMTDRFADGFVEDITRVKEMEAINERRSEIIESLSSENYALYIVDLDADVMEPYILRNEVAEYFARSLEDDQSYSGWLRTYCQRYVVDGDRQMVASQLARETILERMPEGQGAFSISCKRKFGEVEQYVELRLIRLPGEGNEMVLAARNINEEVMKQIRQKEALQSALTLAEHASEAKSTFLTNISHDFRTPLNSIMGFANIALSHPEDAQRVQSCLQKIMTSSEHLLDLINDILDVSRIESGKIVLSEQPLNLVRMMDDLHNVFLGQAMERGVELDFDTAGVEHPDVMGDQLRMNQILVNTVGNALKYTDRGGTVRVSMSEGAVAPNGVAMFEMVVSDTGCGMSEDFIKRIFMPFERDSTGSAHVAEGTGLGMTITKNLIDLLGGTISVSSELGRGSEFTILLPLKLDKHRQPAAGDGEGAEADALRRFDGYRVLVVDDDELSLEMMSEILRDRGFEVEQARDGDEALDAVDESDEGHFDAVIMDMRMPKMTGDVAARAIRMLPRDDVADLPIIAATADAFEEGHRRSREAGMTAHITKPLNIKELMGILEECLRAR